MAGESRVLALLDALTLGLEPVHAAGLVHRDIKPANVMLRGDGSPVLIDFGAARQAMGRQSRAITTVLTPGYAPFEQYNTKGKQGPWTDVYALGAVAYEALSGRVPEEATARMEDDTLRPVAEVAEHGVSPGFAAAIGASLALRGRDRPQSLADWRSRLGLPSAGPGGTTGGTTEDTAPAPTGAGADKVKGGTTGGTAEDTAERPPTGTAGGTAERPPTASRRWRLSVAAVAVVALTVAGLVWLASGVAVPETGGARGVAERTGANSGAGSNAEDSVREAPAVPPEVVEEALGLDLAGWRRIQEGLVALGFDPGEPDGRVGGGTRRAVRSYQAGAGKPATGFLDETDVTRLRYAAADADRLAAEAERRRLAELRRPGRVFRDCDICPQMVVIPAGTFMMGSPASEEGRSDREGPRHEVTLESFAMGVTEVTFDEWEACVRDGGCNGYRPDDEGWGRGSRPVIYMSWEDARAYVRWLSESTGAAYRLPSESEWEYAARAGTTTPFHTGTTISTDQANYGWHRRGTTPAGTFAPNAFGLYDVHGNVWEWVEDCYHYNYSGAPSDGTAWTRGGNCRRLILRGGSWSVDPRDLRSATRISFTSFTSGARVSDAGFRVSRTLD